MDTTILSRILTTYAPNSAGSQEQLIASSLEALDALPQLVSVFADRQRIFEVTIDEFSRHAPAAAVEQFGRELRQHGSDKSTLHDYHKLYAALLHSVRQQQCRIVEVGIGTNNPSILSSMGTNAVPGGSLRAFESLLPKAEIFGADIDPAILFQEGRIRCVKCDQTSESGFDAVIELLAGKKVDIVIDDGLHAVHANLRTLLFGVNVVASGGHVVIEDIPPHMSWFWKCLAGLLAPRHDCTLVRCRSALAFVLRV